MENVRLVSVKSVLDLPECFTSLVSFQIINDKIEAIILTNGNESIRICADGTYSNNLKVLKPQPKKEIQKWRIVGKIDDTIPMQPEVFNDEFTATERQRELTYKFNEGSFDVEPFTEFTEEDKI